MPLGKGATMVKVSNGLILITLIFVTAGSVTGEQLAKEGTEFLTAMYSGTVNVIPQDKDHFVVTYQNKGVLVSDTGKVPFHNMSTYGVGMIYFENGVGRLRGYFTLTDPDGDKVLLEIWEDNTKAAPGVNRGYGKYVHGTGKFAGIEGNMVYERWYVRPASKDTYQEISKSKSNWKLP
jgi:hypothetical protein